MPRIELPKVLMTSDKMDVLDSDGPLRFRLGKECWNYVDTRFRKDHNGKVVVEIMAGHDLVILPSAGNVAYLRVE